MAVKPSATSQGPEFSLRARRDAQGRVELALAGHLVVSNLERALAQVRAQVGQLAPQELTLDLAGVDYLDSAGALGLLILQKEAAQRSITMELSNLSPAGQGILALVDQGSLEPVPPPPPAGPWLEKIGGAVLHLVDDAYHAMVFMGEMAGAVWLSLCHPRKIRWGSVLYYMEKVGADGLPIVGIIGLLMGTIMAFMSSLQLESFGANIYVASLVAIAMVRELGPIITAILVAGRSGSAFAAEIGTMMVNEEVDALVAMGFNPFHFLAIPKVISALIMVPLLTFFADFFAIIGGMIIGVGLLDLTVHGYLKQTLDSISNYGLVSSTIKSAVFGIIVAVVGCQRGFRVQGGASSVGTNTTRAVVTSIFLVIVADSAFAVVMYYLW